MHQLAKWVVGVGARELLLENLLRLRAFVGAVSEGVLALNIIILPAGDSAGDGQYL